jgi:microcin C transport system ATP-binding protein
MSRAAIALPTWQAPGQSLLDVRGLRVAFGAKPVVHGIDFSIAPGEKLALVGESGSGKSVTALSLLGLAQGAQVDGQAWLAPTQEGQDPRNLLDLPERQMLALRGAEIAMVFQEPMTALNPLFSIGDQVAEVIQVKQALTRKQAWAAAVDALAATGIPDTARRALAYPHQLSGGQRQRAMIALALACRPRLLLADEPTTALDVSLRGQILDLLSELQAQTGMAILLITHDLNLVRRFADRVAVMEQGHLVEQGPVGDLMAWPQHPYTQRLVASRPTREVEEGPVPAGTAPCVEARGLSVAYPMARPGLRGWFRKGEFLAVREVSFQVPPGRTLGVIGESGSGKSTLALAALGLLPYRGELDVASDRWGRGRAADLALRRQVQVVFQDPFSSLSPRMTVEEIVGEGLRVHEPGLDAAARRDRVLQALADVGLDEARYPRLLVRYPHEFSGGQRQRLAIARALIVQPRLLVLDEPTSALDVTIQQQVLALLQRLQRERGLAYLLITHDVDVVRAMAHEVVVMKDGRVVESGPAAEVLAAPREAYTQVLVAAAG